MASLSDLGAFDAQKFIGLQQAGNRQRTLSSLGQLAAQGDFRGAQAAAFAGGETDMGLALKQMNDQDKQRLVGQAASWAYQADTPEKWEAGRQQWEAQGFDIGPFQSRDALLSQALTVQDRMTQDYRERQLDLQRQRVAQEGPGGGIFGTPIFMEGPDGRAAIGALTKAGGLQLAEPPEGYRPLGPGDKAYDTTLGKGRAEAAMGLGQTLAKADQSIALIDQMLQHPGREAATGLSSKLDPRNYLAGTDATNFNVMSRQLQGQAFLEAFQSLKGGGQITEVEGQKATEAIARLSTSQSEEAYVQALLELRGILEQGKARAAEAAGQPSNDGGWQTHSNGLRFREVR